jgi:hypothetical protein
VEIGARLFGIGFRVQWFVYIAEEWSTLMTYNKANEVGRGLRSVVVLTTQVRRLFEC